MVNEDDNVAGWYLGEGDAVSLLDDGYHWGTRTFGAVYGSRSEYDGAGGIRINGWNTIVGAGNVHEIKDGRLAWGGLLRKRHGQLSYAEHVQ